MTYKRERTILLFALMALMTIPSAAWGQEGADANTPVSVEAAETEEPRSASPRGDDGKYYLELSLLVPFVYRGERKIQLTPLPSGGELRVGIERDWHVTGAAMVDVFPFGRQRGQLSSFQRCRSRSCFENWLGLQFGTSLERPFEEWYFGVVVEPVSGIALSAGGSLLRGEFLPRGAAEGMLLPAPTTLPVNVEYMWRPFVGVTLTIDLFLTIDHAMSSVLHP